jgi:hypothetical protein
MNKITYLPGNVAAPAVSRASSPKQNRLLARYRDARPHEMGRRPGLVMIWRTHPITGRLECRWSLERSALADEGVSRRNPLRRAA